MNIKTLLAVCLLAFSPLALASNHACECCDQHEMAASSDTKHDGIQHQDSKHLDNHKTCKTHCASGNRATLSSIDHAKHGANHKDMKMCADVADCQECGVKECKDCCESMHDKRSKHAAH